jgi:hypothetical protein
MPNDAGIDVPAVLSEPIVPIKGPDGSYEAAVHDGGAMPDYVPILIDAAPGQ